MENEEKEVVQEPLPEEDQIEATSAEENTNPDKRKRTKREIRNLIIVGCIYGALVALTTTVLIIGYNSSSTSTIPSTHLTDTAAGYYGEDKNLLSHFSTDDVGLVSKEGFYSLSSIASKEGASYMVLPSTYDGTRIMHTNDFEEGTNIFGNDQYSDSVKEIYFPKLYWTIGVNSFSGMDSLAHISLAGASEGRLTISSGAFKDCSSLKTVELPKNLTALGENAFGNCLSLETIDFKGTLSAFQAIADYEKAFTGSSVTIKCSDGELTINNI